MWRRLDSERQQEDWILTIEYEAEEAIEYEQEQEKGGEVELEQFLVRKAAKKKEISGTEDVIPFLKKYMAEMLADSGRHIFDRLSHIQTILECHTYSESECPCHWI